MRIPFVGESYVSKDANEETINLYPELNTEKKVEILAGTPGLIRFATLGAYPIRGMWVMSTDETKLYVVSGPYFYRVLADGSWLQKGEIGTEKGLVSIADNGSEIFIVDGSNVGYCYTPGTDDVAESFETVASPYPGGVTACFLDGMLISNDPASANVRSSGLYDAKTWNVLDVAKAEGDPDNLLYVATNLKQLWLFGRISTEIWHNAALAQGFPFQRVPGGVVEYGLQGQWSVAKVAERVLMLARTNKGERVVTAVTGYKPDIVSSPAINYQISQLAHPYDAEAFAYMQDGHAFYVITFPQGDCTFVYDVSTGRWHRRKSYGIGRWRARCYAFFNNEHMVGDFETGKIYILSSNTYTEDGKPIERIRRCREIIDLKEDYKNIFVDEIQLDMKTGVGLQSGQGEEPKAMLRWSKDNGLTWSNERIEPFGKIGNYRTRIMFHRLGKARRRIFELKITDPVEVVIRGAWVTARKGTS